MSNQDFSHYFKDVSHLKTIDVYRVLDLFNVDNHCIGHAIKKLLCSGQRGAKDKQQDVQEAISSLLRYLEMQTEDEKKMSYQELPVQMHHKYQEFLKFMADCPHRKTPECMQTAFWTWLKIEESLELPFLADKNKRSSGNFAFGSLVRKKSGSEWQGEIVGWYSTGLTPIGYAVESESHLGSVQIYPEAALELVQ